jgi:ribose 5-phosphate isomerase B
MIISIASDHRGYQMKLVLIKTLEQNNYVVKDFGTNSEQSVDYPDFAKLVAESVHSKESDYGVLICGSGMGICIPANKVKGIRAVNVLNEKMAEMSRRHNNANIICFGADFVEIQNAVKCLNVFLSTPFDPDERHHRRVDKVNNLL